LKKERRQERNKRGRVGSLFNYTSSIWEGIAFVDMMVSTYWIGKYMTRDGRHVFQAIYRNLPADIEENNESLLQK
jgi:hypothetical protein